MSNLWTDVRMDPGATAALVAELVASAGAVSEAVALLEGDGPVLVEQWAGPHRRAFDVDRIELADRGRRLAAALLGAAREGEVLLASAQGEQDLRRRLRLRLAAEEHERAARASVGRRVL